MNGLTAILAAAVLLAATILAAAPATKPSPATQPAVPADNGVRAAEVISVHDGDTVTVRIDNGNGHECRVPIRLKGVFAPELKEAGGPEARDTLARYLPAGSRVTVLRFPTSSRGPYLTFQSTLGRDVGVIWSRDGVNVNDALPKWGQGVGAN
jgi:endonuclease YncB( thermonuclease family)